MMSGEIGEKRRNRRGTATREAILGATIDCLHRRGYAGTTIDAVLGEAGLGRGSVLNQFPNRVALIAGAFTRAMQAMFDFVQARAETDPVVRLMQMAPAIWESYQLPAATAVTEILLASRWDTQLAVAIRPDALLMETEIDALMTRIAHTAEIAAIDDLKVHVRALVANFRGLRIELMLRPDRAMIERAIAAQLADHVRVCRLLLAGEPIHA
jgi:AcrR family transcriptional regulator